MRNRESVCGLLRQSYPACGWKQTMDDGEDTVCQRVYPYVLEACEDV